MITEELIELSSSDGLFVEYLSVVPGLRPVGVGVTDGTDVGTIVGVLKWPVCDVCVEMVVGGFILRDWRRERDWEDILVLEWTKTDW